MLHSMTGYGNATGEVGGKKISVQLKSLNSKQADINIKLPSMFRESEFGFRKLISNSLGRGKIEMYLYCEAEETTGNHRINKDVFKQYYEQIDEVLGDLEEEKNDFAKMILQLPGVVENNEEELETSDEKEVTKIIENAISALIGYREKEGASLENDLKQHVFAIQNCLSDIIELEKERLPLVRERLLKNLEEAGQKDKVDPDRFEQEMIYYTEKYDVSEEKVRLKTHCDFFMEMLSAAPGQGKKLGFIAQEMGREINTLGSKANHSGMQKVVVQMKDELEKIKEQVLNVF